VKLGGWKPVHLLVDSTGLKLCGPGKWLVEKHAAKVRRSWRKLHIGVDADTGQIIAAELTGEDVVGRTIGTMSTVRTRIARDDEEPGQPRYCGRDLLREILLLRVAAHVLKREDRE
jgi:hypothetical protein